MKVYHYYVNLVLALILLALMAGCVVPDAASAERLLSSGYYYTQNGNWYGVVIGQGWVGHGVAVYRNGAWSVSGGLTSWNNAQNMINTALSTGYRTASWYEIPPTIKAQVSSVVINGLVQAASVGANVPLLMAIYTNNFLVIPGINQCQINPESCRT